ncbi:MAG: primosomal protein N' [Oscillospiraceae bacterium]|nr:primosomal protein N' [Oscillospiraceae bacterium]
MKNDEAVIAGVAVDNTVYRFDQIFSYRVPDSLKDTVREGKRVLVPFGRGNRLRQGMVMCVSSLKENTQDITNAESDKLKNISSVLDKEILFTDEMLKTVNFIHDRYYCTYYDAVRAMLPAGINYKIKTLYSAIPITEESRDNFNSLDEYTKEIYSYLQNGKKSVEKEVILNVYSKAEPSLQKLSAYGFVKKEDDAFRKTKDATIKMVALCDNADLSTYTLTPKQEKVVDLLKSVGEASLKEICYYTGYTSAVTDTLVKKGIAEYFLDEVMRTPYEHNKYGRDNKEIILNTQQQKSFNFLYEKYKEDKPNASLLYGVTGSGKTSVFMKLIEKCFQDGRGTILMVPEIALTPQLIKIFVSRFGDNIAVFHSGLSIGERLDEYKRVKSGEAKIVLGTRSAVFAPLDDIGLIVLDEEQEASYKSQQTPRYHARDVAKFRCSCYNGLLLLSSATPSIESYYMAQKGLYSLVTLSNRYGNSKLPKVSVVDMNEEIMSGNTSCYSSYLKELLADNLLQNKQSIILLNRRGYNTFLSCRSCGQIVTCPSCSISMTYHSANNRLMCHYCGHSVPYTDECPDCHNQTLRLCGAGTQKAEQELVDMFPDARVLRMDADATMSKSSYERKLTAFANGEYDILIGTQMVAKGLNFPNVTLVGVLNADQMLYSDDYRSFERAFSLLTQVVGRSGRGEHEGIAVIQTTTPESHVISLASIQDYDKFYNGEIGIRKTMLYPPFSDICLVGFSGINEGITIKCSVEFQKRLIAVIKEKFSSLPIRLLGPSKAAVYKISNKYRYKTIIKCRNTRDFRSAVTTVLKEFSAKKEFKNISITVDTNPQSFN